MLVTFIVYLLFTQAICIDKDDLHACFNTVLREYYCCSDYEDLNGICTACEIGFKSRTGLPCTPCPHNLYGHGCSSLCECGELQRCDHVRGCVLKEVSSTGYSKTGTGPVEVSTNEGIAVSILDENDRSETVTVYGTTISDSTECKRLYMYHYGFQLELLIYSASVTGVLLILGICYLCKRCNNRRKKSRASVTVDDEITQNDPPNESRETFELSEGLYHTIDEDKISISSVNDNPYLEVVNGSPGSDSIKNGNGKKVRYTPPNHGHITTTADNYLYENSRPVSFKSHDRISSIQETDQDYLTPSKPIKDNSPLTFEAEIFAMIHAETYSSSGSENDKNHKNDGIDYLNSYQPLERCSKTEKDNVYDIPLTGPAKLTLDNVVEQLSKYEKNNIEML